jgi:gamma-glutamyltranspeptidase/glutathione hydrolase
MHLFINPYDKSGGVMAMHRLSRHLVYGCRGMVCSNSPLAASVGIKILQEGGNAFDAALAVAAVETVVIVPACGLGGDSFVLLHEADRHNHRRQ